MWPWKRKKSKVVRGKDDARRSVSFSMSRGVPIILCTINGKGSKLLIDSGASLNVLEKSYAKRFGFVVWKQQGSHQVSGIGGSSNMMGVSKVKLMIDATITKMPFKSISFSGVHKKLGVVGVIGSKFLRDHNAIIDYENRLVTWDN